MDPVYMLILRPGSTEVERHGPTPVDWGHAPFAGYIGDDLHAVSGQDGAYNEAGTVLANALRRQGEFIYGELGLARRDGGRIAERTIAFVEAVIKHPTAVAALHPEPGSEYLIATAVDWATLAIGGEPHEPIPVNQDRERLEWMVGQMDSLVEEEPTVTDGLLEARLHSDDIWVSVKLVEREELDTGHFNTFLREHFDGEPETVQADASEYRSGEFWNLALMMRILREAKDGADIGTLLDGAKSGVPEEYLFLV